MRSQTKVSLSHSDIHTLFHAAFGDAAVPSIREMTDGWFNTAYHLTTDTMQTVLKIGPPPEAEVLSYEKNLLRAEVETMKLAASNPEIPVPRILYDDFSRTRLPCEYYFMEFIEGTPWNTLQAELSDEQNHAVEYQLGRMTAALNAFEHTAFGYYAFGRQFDTWPDAFRWMCALLFADAERFQIPLELAEQGFFEYFERYREYFADVTRPQLVHWDLWPGNIFLTFDGAAPKIAGHPKISGYPKISGHPKISGIIDFERALWGDPLMESYHGRLSEMPHYFAGYGENLFATRSQRVRRIFYNIYLFLIMIIEDGPRQYDDKGSVEWAKVRLRHNIAMMRHGDVIRDA